MAPPQPFCPASVTVRLSDTAVGLSVQPANRGPSATSFTVSFTPDAEGHALLQTTVAQPQATPYKTLHLSVDTGASPLSCGVHYQVSVIAENDAGECSVLPHQVGRACALA